MARLTLALKCPHFFVLLLLWSKECSQFCHPTIAVTLQHPHLHLVALLPEPIWLVQVCYYYPYSFFPQCTLSLRRSPESRRKGHELSRIPILVCVVSLLSTFEALLTSSHLSSSLWPKLELIVNEKVCFYGRSLLFIPLVANALGLR